ncbi:MAG TPA: dual specificity protein phosphatase family protein [Tepidisphaeraceae bacterium]|jgi:protein-tyrosine phosphatase|nr:dual specificity protein phosphatase family protein [Tepidisphaeraceae bacterium]
MGTVLAWESIHNGGWQYVLLWPAVTILYVAFGYALAGGRIFGKRADGTLHPIAVVLLAPYLVPTWTIWQVRRALYGRPIGQEVAPGLWLGRRVSFAELPPGIRFVCDLTAEFSADRKLRRNVTYCCIPVLDGTTGADESVLKMVDRICRINEPVYIHCAVGYGRSASMMAAVLIAKRIADDLESAEALLEKMRPGVHINRAQRKQLARLVSLLAAARTAPPLS